MSRIRTLGAVVFLASILILAGASCAATHQPDSDELVGAEETGAGNDAVSGNLHVGDTLIATANVNLRTGPSTSKSILHVVPEGSSVTVLAADPQNGFYNVKHNGTAGWSYGQYYKASGGPGPGPGPGPNGARADAIARAQSAMGFSYWWGHGRFRPEGPNGSNNGSCSGSCPNCSHGGQYGGDCSGLAAKVWEVPGSNDDLTVDSHPYSTASFVDDTSLWSTVSRSNLLPADAMVYHSGGAGHIFIYSSGDGWGSMDAYECKGCSAGCVHDLRTASAAYHGIRRAGY